MSFESEKEAFKQYILSSPTNCVLLVDTYSTIQGTKNAISAVKEYLAEPEKNFLAIRIDSGDLAYLSKKARLLLDQAGFHNTKIIASNNLDEHIIVLNEISRLVLAKSKRAFGVYSNKPNLPNQFG